MCRQGIRTRTCVGRRSEAQFARRQLPWGSRCTIALRQKSILRESFGCGRQFTSSPAGTIVERSRAHPIRGGTGAMVTLLVNSSVWIDTISSPATAARTWPRTGRCPGSRPSTPKERSPDRLERADSARLTIALCHAGRLQTSRTPGTANPANLRSTASCCTTLLPQVREALLVTFGVNGAAFSSPLSWGCSAL